MDRCEYTFFRFGNPRERVLFIGTQFSILYTSMYAPSGWPGVSFEQVLVKDGSLRISGKFFTPAGLRPQ